MKKFLKFITGKSEEKIDHSPVSVEQNIIQKPEPIQVEFPPISTTPHTEIEETQGDCNSVLRAEYNLIKYPFFALSHKASKTDKIERIEIKRTISTSDGLKEILWRVDRGGGRERKFPSSFARRLHIEVVERAINEMKRPIPKLIRLGTVSDICRKMGINTSGKNFKNIKDALRDIAFAGIETKNTFFVKGPGGKTIYPGGVIHLYDSVIWVDENLPNGERADSVFVSLGDLYLLNYNSGYNIPLDYSFLHSLKGDIASRLYELMSSWFYPMLEQGKDSIQRNYSMICAYAPLTRQRVKSEAKRQLKKSHDQFLENEFLSSVEWQGIQGKSDDWLLRYVIGDRAKDWHERIRRVWDVHKVLQQDTHHTLTGPQNEPHTKTPLRSGSKEPTPGEKSPAENPLIQELTSLGVAQKTAVNLASNFDHQIIRDQIDALPHRRNIDDKAAFLVQAIRDNFPLPKEFTKKRARVETEQEEQLKDQYHCYIINQVNEHLSRQDPDETERQKQAYQPIFRDKLHPSLQVLDPDGEYIRGLFEQDFKRSLAEKLNLPDFKTWKRKQGG